jgi:ribonuclease D
MEGRLKEAELVEEASIEFRRLEVRDPAPRAFDPWGFLRIRGSRDLPERGRAVLRALVAMREERSKELDRPPFKVLANDTLLRIAAKHPADLGALRGIRGITPFVLKRHGEDILAAVRTGLADPEPVPNRAPATPPEPGDGDRRLSFAAQKRHGRLKEWRSARSAALGRTTLAILPNPALFEVARTPPRDVAALAAVPGVGTHRARLYGEEILRVVGPKGG